ncbi:MAG: ABC transporter permease subunit [Candidatus Bipolaricaulia bacterium]
MVHQRQHWHRWSPFFLAGLLAVLVIAAFYGSRAYLLRPGFVVPAELPKLPLYALFSFARMLAAYFISLLFALGTGYLAATSRWAERLLIPALDILQSVPILGFFPAAIYLFVSLTGGGRLGVELASVFLIFTSQAWNMAFGVYEGILTIPQDGREALAAFGAKRWLVFKRLLFPACVPKLVYNTIMSWAGGWYFLMAAEIIAIGPARYDLPGLGSLMYRAAEEGRLGLMLLALGILIGVIVAMDLLLWRPLSVWAETFRYEFAASSPGRSRVLDWWRRSGAVKRAKALLKRASGLLASAAMAALALARRSPMKALSTGIGVAHRFWRACGWGLALLVGAFLGYLAWTAASALAKAFAQPLPQEAAQIPLAILASFGRLALAYLVSLGWTVPLSIWIGENERVARIATPIAEIGASIPATALFPLIILFMIRVFGGMNIASILLILTGMQWYLLFNLIAGARAVPQDLKEMAKSLRLPRWHYWRKVVLPALFPSLLTGSITGWGGGWNALIVAEYIVYNQRAYQVLGIGALLDRATYELGSGLLIFLTLGAMVTVILLLNRLLWRRLYRFAVERYRLEY